MDWSFIIIILQLIFLEGILSIDNAAVLGAMVTPLPDDRPVEWPTVLKSLGNKLNKFIGNQRNAALRVGLLGAYVGRGIMLILASLIIQNPWLKLIGAAYLIRLAFDNLSASGMGEGGDSTSQPVKAKTFWTTVLSVELMDLAFSLDNVVAAVSLSDKLWVVMIGVAIGILTMRFAASLFSYIIEKEPILQQAAYILVFNIGVELLIEDLGHIQINDWMRFCVTIATILLTLAYKHVKFLRIFRPALIWFSQGFAIFNTLINWLLIPIIGIINMLWKGIRYIFSLPQQTT